MRVCSCFGLLVSLVLLAARPIFAAEPTQDTLDQVKANLVDKKAVLVDVRETDEWKAGHLTEAINVPLSMLKSGAEAPEFAAVLAQQMPKNRIVYLHCKSGVRCRAAADLLKKYGYDARPLKAGYDDLVRAGFPKTK
ncbi:MAG TPA: rhodanese-like domain-containing protein [Pirellulales bacterium]|jgi:rhodanese-related sulfurtransferase|nr:rhodanese-like domain-containing protein [Pirellulales bacterium]